MVFFKSNHLEITNYEQFKKLSYLYQEFCFLVYSNEIPWSLDIFNNKTLSNFLNYKCLQLFTVDASKYPEIIKYLDINIFPIILVYKDNRYFNQISPLLEDVVSVLDKIL